MSLWKNVDHPSGNGKPLFANTSNLTSSSTIHGASANTMKNYGSVFGVSANEVANSSQRIAHPGWVSQKIHTGFVQSLAIVSGGTGINSAGVIEFTDTASGTGALASFTIANVRNPAQGFSTNSAWNVISTVTMTNHGTGYTNAATVTAAANIANSTPATFGVVLGGRAGRITYETLVAMGSISSDDPADDVWFPGS